MNEGDARSLTSGFSKILEDFVVKRMLKEKIDPCQFGCLMRLSTTFCLLDIFHTWNICYKALSFAIQSNLKWDEHTRSIIAKASKRLHILRILRWCGIPPVDLIKIYIALIRSIVEYSCEVWGNTIIQYHSVDPERVKK